MGQVSVKLVIVYIFQGSPTEEEKINNEIHFIQSMTSDDHCELLDEKQFCSKKGFKCFNKLF